jgi:hypothetical protein
MKVIEDATTLKPVSDVLFDFGKSKFQLANETLSDERLLNAGVTDSGIWKTLGFFGVFLVIMLISIGIYLLLKWLSKLERFACLKTAQHFLSKKLFFNSILRYLIVSNHKITYMAFAYWMV